MVETLVPSNLSRLPITEIGRSHVAQVHNDLAKTPYQANRLLAVLRKFFNWCEQNGFRADHSNPTLHVVPFKECKRE
ncbi:hypothetical protein [Hoeflea alexandrii]|uniref:hypothetical protein n=1 Tax=Hoeflea alexandrii TaxID=288436 RepID=UPI0022B06027|nr:hypothetical protein [Hoeflea alexandrii]MCZ4287726.1 hypothetical protein [Hoeflea alexandrii]